MAERFCKVCRGWHDLDKPWPHNCLPERKMARADLPAPAVIADTMPPVQSMLDGKLYDSKAALRATYKAAGVTEVGNDSSVLDPKPFQKRYSKREDIKTSVRRAASRVGIPV